AILAVGDGAATLVGSSVTSPRLPWNPEKSTAGTLAFVVLSAIAGIGLAWWTRPAISPHPSMTFVIAAPAIAAIVAARVETIPPRPESNVSGRAAPAALPGLGSRWTAAAWAAARPAVVATLSWAFGVNAVVSYAGYRARTVNVAGWIGGAAIGIVI